jgi:hypothetical protein
MAPWQPFHLPAATQQTEPRTAMDHLKTDNFRNRGAVEQESPDQEGNLDFRGQLGHRNKDPLIDSYDTDFPEPGENPEHTGEAVMAEDRNSKREGKDAGEEFVENEVDQDPGERQKENQNQEKDDPLAA